MRIFTAVRHANDPTWFYGGLWASNFYPALRRLGLDIVESQTDLLPASKFMHVGKDFTPAEREVRARTTEQILDELERAHRDEPIGLFLSYFYNAHFDPAGFDVIRRLGIPSINFYCNSIYQFELVTDVARKADYAWHAERDARARYRQVGANPVWVQMGADPDVYRPVEGTVRQAAACFVGQRYADRDRWMSALVKANLPVSIYGPGWRSGHASGAKTSDSELAAQYLGRRLRQAGTIGSYMAAARSTVSRDGVIKGTARIVRQVRYRNSTSQLTPLFADVARGPIAFDEIASVFSAHEVCLNFSHVWADGRPGSDLIPHVRLRDFEGPMCRTCYLTGHTDEIAEFYRIGREIDTYRSEEELVDKVRFYLAKRDRAEQLRVAGHARARRDHTWDQRFRELFRKTGLRPDEIRP